VRKLDAIEHAFAAVGQNIEDAARVDARVADAAELMP
jgi:hypothetical protein